MGQKVNPVGLRLGIIKTWDSQWFAERGYQQWLHEDLKLKQMIKKKYHPAAIERIEVARTSNNITVTINCARPGMIIGKQGSEIEQLKMDIHRLVHKDVSVAIKETRKPEASGQLIAENIAQQLERRIAFRRAMKRSISSAMRFGVKGIKIAVSGRLAGAEIARRERYHEGQVPLHTLRADIDYGFAEAHTTYGLIGVKVWVYRGQIFAEKGARRP